MGQTTVYVYYESDTLRIVENILASELSQSLEICSLGIRE